MLSSDKQEKIGIRRQKELSVQGSPSEVGYGLSVESAQHLQGLQCHFPLQDTSTLQRCPVLILRKLVLYGSEL